MLGSTPLEFNDEAKLALADANLQKALAGMDDTFVAWRASAVERLPEFEALRDAAKGIKDHALANLDFYLERFADNVEPGGGKVHWCGDADAARAAVLAICRRVGARTVTKGKTMIGEEIAINEHLEANGITPVETDLGEYIIQLRHETPSHLIAPAIHLTVEQVGETFREAHQGSGPQAPAGRSRRHAERGAHQAAQEFPGGRCRHHRRQFPDRRDGQHRHRHQ
jgi:Uncharacterized conserved protein containing a ferredoxin-like domain